jgi:uncharacterized protein YigA (DUF484 family)
MSQHKGELPLLDASMDDSVADYLRSHPDFFDRHALLLSRLRLPHSTGGPAVSLVERQVAVLRERCAKLEHQLTELVAVAKFNDGLAEKIHQLAAVLIAATSTEARLRCIETSLREDFLAERAVMLLFADTADGVLSDGFVKVVARDDPQLAVFGSFLTSPRARCGLIPEGQKEALFGRDADTVGSAAILPLGQPPGLRGLLVIGNHDPAHFNPGKRMDFLNRLGALVTAVLERASGTEA